MTNEQVIEVLKKGISWKDAARITKLPEERLKTIFKDWQKQAKGA